MTVFSPIHIASLRNKIRQQARCSGLTGLMPLAGFGMPFRISASLWIAGVMATMAYGVAYAEEHTSIFSTLTPTSSSSFSTNAAGTGSRLGRTGPVLTSPVLTNPILGAPAFKNPPGWSSAGKPSDAASPSSFAGGNRLPVIKLPAYLQADNPSATSTAAVVTPTAPDVKLPWEKTAQQAPLSNPLAKQPPPQASPQNVQKTGSQPTSTQSPKLPNSGVPDLVAPTAASTPITPTTTPENPLLQATPTQNAFSPASAASSSAPSYSSSLGAPAEPIMSPDKARRLNTLGQTLRYHQRWLSDAVSLQLTTANQDLPTSTLLTMAHKANNLQRWGQFYQANGNYEQALNQDRQAEQAFLTASAMASPSFRVEGRAIWLDRGSIIASQTPDNLRSIIRQLHQLGINTLFVETFNAGYPLYKSQTLAPNPLLEGNWDPLAVAVETAHQLGMEAHAWVWCFAVGNVRHNAIVNQPPEYAGPILVEKGMMSEALRGATGNLIPRKGVQHEYWLSPASPKAQSYLMDIYKEIVTKYPVDGLQLDYIRYPFQNADHQMGYESISKNRFEEETNLYLNSMDDYTLKSFIAWKTFQVSHFVETVAGTLKAINPNLKLSAAVYPMGRQERILAIQQDWETWLDKGWIDFLSPMTYTPSPANYQSTLAALRKTTQLSSIIYPGIALHRLDGAETVRLQRITQDSGLSGNTLFANAHLDASTTQALNQGTFRVKPAVPPHRNPGNSARLIIEEVLGVTTALAQQGDHQWDEWAGLLKQTDQVLSGWQQFHLSTQATQLAAYQAQIKAMASQCQQQAETSPHPYRVAWLGVQFSRLHQLLGVAIRVPASS
jgi:uncharacterized lipoprotein YddW (UPF0748 family)